MEDSAALGARALIRFPQLHYLDAPHRTRAAPERSQRRPDPSGQLWCTDHQCPCHSLHQILLYPSLVKDHATMAEEFSIVAAFHGSELIKSR